VKLTVDYGQDPHTQKWFCPQQQAWGLLPHQKITPGLAEKLCFTAAASTSYEQAAAVAARWGVAVDDSIIHQQVQRAGERADQQAQARIPSSAAPTPKTAVPPGALVIMMDAGCCAIGAGLGDSNPPTFRASEWRGRSAKAR
jgi:hypothetical protein